MNIIPSVHFLVLKKDNSGDSILHHRYCQKLCNCAHKRDDLILEKIWSNRVTAILSDT